MLNEVRQRYVKHMMGPILYNIIDGKMASSESSLECSPPIFHTGPVFITPPEPSYYIVGGIVVSGAEAGHRSIWSDGYSLVINGLNQLLRLDNQDICGRLEKIGNPFSSLLRFFI